MSSGQQLSSERDYNAWVTPRLVILPPRHQSAFAADAAERQLGTYAHLARDDRSLKPEALREVLDVVWDYIAGGPISEAALAKGQAQIETLIPDLNDPHAPQNAPLILSTVGAVAYAARSCVSRATANARAAGSCAIEAVHEWLDNLLRPGLSVLRPQEIRAAQLSIDQHPLMIRELDHMQAVVQFLSETTELDHKSCNALRRLWSNGNKSNIDLE